MDIYSSPQLTFQTKMPREYVVQKIVGKRLKNGNQIQYKVKWKGYDSRQNTWQPLKHLKNINEMIREFEERNKLRLKQLSRNLPQQNKIKASSQQKKTFKKDNLKKLLKSYKFDNQQQKQRQSVKTIRRQRKEIESNGQISQSQNKNVLEGEVKETYTLNRSIQKDKISQYFKVPDSQIDWDSLSKKIINASMQKQKLTYQIIGIVKTKPGQADHYLIQDSSGQLSRKTKDFVLKNLSSELIAFYQKQMSSNL